MFSSAHHEAETKAASRPGQGRLIDFHDKAELHSFLNSLPGDGRILSCEQIDLIPTFDARTTYHPLIEAVEKACGGAVGVCDLVYADLVGDSPVQVEIAEFEMSTRIALVTSLLQGLVGLRRDGDLIVRLRSTCTRFTAGIILVVSTVFQNVCIYRPPSRSHWTGDRYVFCKSLISADNGLIQKFLKCLWIDLKRGSFSQVVPQEHNAGSASSSKPKTIYEVVRPPFFTAECFSRWLLETNARLAAFEILECERRLEVAKEINCSASSIDRRNRPELCRKFLRESGLDTIFSPFHRHAASIKTMPRHGFETLTRFHVKLSEWKSLFLKRMDIPGIQDTMADLWEDEDRGEGCSRTDESGSEVETIRTGGKAPTHDVGTNSAKTVEHPAQNSQSMQHSNTMGAPRKTAKVEDEEWGAFDEETAVKLVRETAAVMFDWRAKR